MRFPLAPILIFWFAGAGLVNAQVFVGRTMDVTNRPPKPAAGVKLTMLSTNQEVVADSNGVFQFSLARSIKAGSEIQIGVKYRGRDLCILSPQDGIITVPAEAGKPVEIHIVDCSYAVARLTPAEIEEALDRSQRTGEDLVAELKKLAARKRIGLKEVRAAVESWVREVDGNPSASGRQRELVAHFQAQGPNLSALQMPSGIRGGYVLGLDPYLTLVADFDLRYRSTELSVFNSFVGQWDGRVEIWLPPFRRSFEWGPYIHVAGIGAVRPTPVENVWSAAPGVGFQVYPLSVPVLTHSSSRLIRVLGPVRIFGEYNRMSFWAEADSGRPRKQFRYGLEYLRAMGVNSRLSPRWFETWNTFNWVSANEFDPIYKSWILRNIVRFGVRRTSAGVISSITPYLALDSALSGKKTYYWDNRLIAGAGLRYTPRFTGRVEHSITRFAVYGEYVRTASYYHQPAQPSTPSYEIRVGITFSTSNWYR